MSQEVLILQSTYREAQRWKLVSFILLGLAILLVLLIMMLLPLKTTKVKYVEFAESGKQTFRIVPSPLSKKQKVLLVRQILRDYVIKRISYTGSLAIDTPNVKQVAAMSSREVIQQYKLVYNRIHEDTTIEKREVKIISDIPIGKNAHQVQYRTIDHFRGQTYEHDWVATIEYAEEKMIVKEEDELLNPLGIVVTRFIEAKKQLTDEDLNEIF